MTAIRFWREWARQRDWAGLLVVLLGVLLVVLAVFWVVVIGALLFSTYIGGAPQLDERRTEASAVIA